MKMGDILLLIYRSDQRSRKFQYLGLRMWGSAADATSYCSSVGATSFLPVSDLDPSPSYVEIWGRRGALAASARRGTQLRAASITNRSATAEVLLSLQMSFPSRWTGQISDCNPLLPHARGVGREKLLPALFSKSS